MLHLIHCGTHIGILLNENRNVDIVIVNQSSYPEKWTVEICHTGMLRISNKNYS